VVVVIIIATDEATINYTTNFNKNLSICLVFIFILYLLTGYEGNSKFIDPEIPTIPRISSQ